MENKAFFGILGVPMENYQGLVEKLIDEGYLKTPDIIRAFQHVGRAGFLPDEKKEDAAVNAPLPIGYGQTISQPLTVAFMIELLQPKKGDHIFDVGYGSGWQTALLSTLVGPGGRIVAIERVRPVADFGRHNVEVFGCTNVTFVVGAGTRGYKKNAPYDKIIVAAGAEQIPKALLEQLTVPGRLVIPVGRHEHDMVKIDRKGKKDFSEERFPGFQFVPLIPSEWGSE